MREGMGGEYTKTTWSGFPVMGEGGQFFEVRGSVSVVSTRSCAETRQLGHGDEEMGRAALAIGDEGGRV